jgi:hypothetical protein
MIVVTRSSSRLPSIALRSSWDISCDPAFREDGFEERRIGIDRLADARPITSVIEKLLTLRRTFTLMLAVTYSSGGVLTNQGLDGHAISELLEQGQVITPTSGPRPL